MCSTTNILMMIPKPTIAEKHRMFKKAVSDARNMEHGDDCYGEDAIFDYERNREFLIRKAIKELNDFEKENNLNKP